MGAAFAWLTAALLVASSTSNNAPPPPTHSPEVWIYHGDRLPEVSSAIERS